MKYLYLKYIKSNENNQSINTGITVGDNPTLYLDIFKTHNGDKVFIRSEESQIYDFSCNYSSNFYSFIFWFNRRYNNSISNASLIIDGVTNTRHTLLVKKTSIIFDNKEYTKLKNNREDGAENKNLRIILNRDDIFYDCYFYNGDKKEFHLQPVKRISDNAVGVLDTVNDIFYTGNYSAGPVSTINFRNVKFLTIPEGKVTKIEDNEGRVLWSALPDPNKYAYGIRWDHTVPESQATTACERIGNLELHKTLPIQSKFATCIHQGTNIKYWCDPNDSRFRKDNTGFRIVNERIYLEQTTDAEKNAVSSDYSPSATYNYTIQFPDDVLNKYEEAKLLVTTYKYLYAWIKINDVNIARVNKVDTVNKKAYITTDGLIPNDNIGTITPTLEFGCSINGYDGEISVYTPKFYIWSIDKDGAGNEVWISEKKCVGYAREVKAHLIGISRCPLLRTAMNDSKWGWLNTLSDNTSVSVVNYQPNLRGGTNDTSYDQYLGDNNFRTMLGKAASNMQLSTIRTYTQKIKGSQVLYYQIWNAIVWCYFIEYADFDVKKAFNSNLTNEGYHQGGLGEGLIDINNFDKYNSRTPIVPIDYTLSAGNNTKIIQKLSHSFDSYTQKQLNVPCYRGFNTFWYGDTWLNIENFISQYDSTSNKRKFYFTDNPNNFSNDINNKEHIIEITPDLNGWVKEIAIGNNADLITNKVSNSPNYTNCNRFGNRDNQVHVTTIGGRAMYGVKCGLAFLDCSGNITYKYSSVAFAKCYILN